MFQAVQDQISAAEFAIMMTFCAPKLPDIPDPPPLPGMPGFGMDGASEETPSDPGPNDQEFPEVQSDALWGNSPPDPKNYSILHGRFYAAETEWGPNGPFIYVPKGWIKPDKEYIETIFAALGLDVPNLVFTTDECDSKIFPEIGVKYQNGKKTLEELGLNPEGANRSLKVVSMTRDEGQQKLIYDFMLSKLESKLKIVTEACFRGGAYFLCNEADRGNTLVNSIVKALPKGGVALSICSLESGPRLGFTKNMVDAIKRNVMRLEESIDYVKKYRVFWSGDGLDWYPNQRLAHGMTHHLVFDNAEDMHYFQTVLASVVPVGMVCAAGGSPLLETAVKTLREGMPLVTFKHTFGTGHTLSSILEYQEAVATANLPQPAGAPKPPSWWKKLLSKKEAKNDDNEIELVRAPPSDWDSNLIGLNEIIEEKLFPHGENVYQVTEQHKVLANQLVLSWPDSIKPTQYAIVDAIDVRGDQPLIVQITDAINSVYVDPEEGGEEAEFAALDNAAMLYVHLQNVHRAMAKLAFQLSVIIIIMKLGVTAVAVIINFIMTTPVATQMPAVVTALTVLNTVLPISLGIFMTMEASWNPVGKSASLKYAKERILNEWFKFRMKVGPYEPRFGMVPGQAKRAFQSNIDLIMEGLDGIELSGAMPKLKGGKGRATAQVEEDDDAGADSGDEEDSDDEAESLAPKGGSKSAAAAAAAAEAKPRGRGPPKTKASAGYDSDDSAGSDGSRLGGEEEDVGGSDDESDSEGGKTRRKKVTEPPRKPRYDQRHFLGCLACLGCYVCFPNKDDKPKKRVKLAKKGKKGPGCCATCLGCCAAKDGGVGKLKPLGSINAPPTGFAAFVASVRAFCGLNPPVAPAAKVPEDDAEPPAIPGMKRKRLITRKVDAVSMSVEEYLKERVMNEMLDLAIVTPVYVLIDLALPIILTAAGSGTALLSGFNASSWTPAVMAAIAAFETFSRFRQWPEKTKQCKLAIEKLVEIIAWWELLPQIQKRLWVFKVALVNKVESVHMTKATALTTLRQQSS